MIGEYRGKKLFAGRLFAGRLFGPAPSDAGGGGFRPRRVFIPRRLDDRTGADSDALLLAVTMAAGLGVLQ